MPREITGVGRVAEATVTLLVGGMLHMVRGQLVTGEAELIGGRRESDVSCTLYVRDRVTNCAAHCDSGVDILSRGLVLVACETFGGIDVCGESHGMLVKVGSSRRSRKQQEENNQQCGAKDEALGRVRDRHSSPFAESVDSVYFGERRRFYVWRRGHAAASISPGFPAGNISSQRVHPPNTPGDHSVDRVRPHNHELAESLPCIPVIA